jgi:CHAT domain-containing protein
VITLRTTTLQDPNAVENTSTTPSRGLQITKPVETLVSSTRQETTQGVTAFQPKGDISLSERIRRQQLELSYQRTAQLLITPIVDLLPQTLGARVIFIPHRSLFLVPFAALPVPGGKRLIEQYTISEAPSLQVLALQAQQKQSASFKPRRPLIVGNPTMPSLPPRLGESPIQLAALPGAGVEAQKIAQLLHTTALTGEGALESVVVKQMPQADFIHFATHGLIDELNYLDMVVPGAIALAPERPYQADIKAPDGLLTANEILDLKLQADLVVLSACNTGKGKITGDGVIGLSRALMTAGVPTVVVSLWSVPDAPTADLMVAFYEALQHNPDKATALRQAMLKTMQIYDDPTDWAAFVMMGR